VITAIILAAGDSSRMGSPKALLSLEDSTFLEVILTRIRKANYENVIVVLGHHYDLICNTITMTKEYDIIRNPNPEQGQLSSLKLTLSKIKQAAQGALIVLVDHPLVSDETYQIIYEKACEKPDSIIIPVHNNRKGHPVYFGKKFFKALNQAPISHGARYVVHNNESSVIEVPVADEGVIKDIDTPEQYNKIT